MNKYLEQWASKPMMRELEQGVINAPNDLLGCHIFKEEDVQIFTAYRPCAQAVWVLDHRGKVAGEMEPMELEGLFGFVIEKKSARLKTYRLRIQYAEDDIIEIDDPYAFGKMFGELDKYQEESYFQEHREMMLHTEDGLHTYEVIAVFPSQVYKKTDQVFKFYQFFQADTQEEFDYFYDNIKELSLYDTGVTAEFGDRFLTLSTCSYHVDRGRFVVVAKETGYEDIYAPFR